MTEARAPRDPLSLVPLLRGPGATESLTTVLVAFTANLLIAVAKSAAALVGLLIAGAGLAAHQLSGSAVPDAVASILVGVLLGVVAVVLINQNRRFLVGVEADPRVRAAVLNALLDLPESHVAVRLRALEEKFCVSPAVVGTVLSLSAPDEPSLRP